MKTNTKKILAVIGITLINLATVFAQNNQFYVGSRFGIGESTLDFKDATRERSKLLIAGGISTAFQFNRFVGVTSDFMFVSKGGKYNGQIVAPDFFGQDRVYTYHDQYDIYSAEIPLALKLTFPVGNNFAFKAYGGPSFQFQLLGAETRNYDDPDFHNDNGYSHRKLNDLQTMETGLVYGLGFEVNSVQDQTFFLDFRLNQSLSNMGLIQSQEVKSSYYMLSIGYLF